MKNKINAKRAQQKERTRDGTVYLLPVLWGAFRFCQIGCEGLWMFSSATTMYEEQTAARSVPFWAFSGWCRSSWRKKGAQLMNPNWWVLQIRPSTCLWLRRIKNSVYVSEGYIPRLRSNNKHWRHGQYLRAQAKACKRLIFSIIFASGRLHCYKSQYCQ